MKAQTWNQHRLHLQQLVSAFFKRHTALNCNVNLAPERGELRLRFVLDNLLILLKGKGNCVLQQQQSSKLSLTFGGAFFGASSSDDEDDDEDDDDESEDDDEESEEDEDDESESDSESPRMLRRSARYFSSFALKFSS